MPQIPELKYEINGQVLKHDIIEIEHNSDGSISFVVRVHLPDGELLEFDAVVSSIENGNELFKEEE